MKIYNLESSERYKAKVYIERNLGGKVRLQEAIKSGGKGIGGMRYQSGLNEINNRLNPKVIVSIEKYKSGLGFYLRSNFTNHLVLIPYFEIKMMSLTKKNDLILPSSSSLFLRLLNLNFPYHFAKIFILDKEKVELNDYLLSIYMEDKSELIFSIDRLNPYKVINFINKSISEIPIKEKIDLYLLLDKN